MTSLVARPVTLPNRVGQRVTVRTMNDFPAPSAGVITLAPDTQYNVVGIGLTTPDRFECTGSVSITGLWTFGDITNPQLTYTGTGTMFTVSEGSFDISNINLNCPNGTFLDVNSPSVVAGFKFSNAFIVACQKLGTLQNLDSIDVADNASFSTGDGWTININSPQATLSIRQFGFIGLANGAIGVDLGNSVLRTAEFRDCIFDPVPAATPIGISGLPNSGNIAAGNLASVSSCEFRTGVVALSGITEDDTRWNFVDNVGVPDTAVRALNNIVGNAVETVITTSGVFVPVAGTWTLIDNSQVIQGAAATSQLQNQSEFPRRFALDVSITLRSAAATPRCRVQVYSNGSPLPGAAVTIETSSTEEQSGSITWSGVGTINELFELYLANFDTTDNITMVEATTRLIAFAS